MTTEGQALRKLREEYERDPRPLRMVKTTYQVLVEMHQDSEGHLSIEVDGDAAEVIDQTIEAIEAALDKSPEENAENSLEGWARIIRGRGY